MGLSDTFGQPLLFFCKDTFVSADGVTTPSTTLTGSISTSKNTGCLRLQPTGFDTSNHGAKIQ